MASSHRALDLSDSHPGGEQIRSPHESPITSHESRALDPPFDPARNASMDLPPRKSLETIIEGRTEPANSIPAPWTLVLIDPAPESLSPLPSCASFPLCFPACPGRGRAASSHRGVNASDSGPTRQQDRSRHESLITSH